MRTSPDHVLIAGEAAWGPYSGGVTFPTEVPSCHAGRAAHTAPSLRLPHQGPGGDAGVLRGHDRPPARRERGRKPRRSLAQMRAASTATRSSRSATTARLVFFQFADPADQARFDPDYIPTQFRHIARQRDAVGARRDRATPHRFRPDAACRRPRLLPFALHARTRTGSSSSSRSTSTTWIRSRAIAAPTRTTR